MVKKSLVKSFVGKTVYDLMMVIPKRVSCQIIDSETDDFEFPDIVGFGSKMLTEEGHKKWDNILKKYTITDVIFDSDFKDFDKNVDTDNLTVYVESKIRNDYGEALYDFEMCFAGYCSDSDYNKWFTDFSQTVSGFKTSAKRSHKAPAKKCGVTRMVGNIKGLENSVKRIF